MTCGSCRHFTEVGCTRFPPQMVLWPTDNQHPLTYLAYATYPQVAANTPACGEHKERPHE